MSHHRIQELPTDVPMPGIVRRRLIGERAMLSILTLEAGVSVAEHSHDNEQFACVLSGELRFTIGDGDERQVVTAVGGDVVHLPGGVPHAVEALAETRVLDVFAPPSAGTGIDAPEARRP